MVQLSRWKIVVLALALVFGLLLAFPNALSKEARDKLPGWVPSNALNLGLDLQGGSYLLLEVDVPAMRAKRLDNLVEDVRVTMREARIDLNGIQRDENGVVVTLADASRQTAAFDALRQFVWRDL